MVWDEFGGVSLFGNVVMNTTCSWAMPSDSKILPLDWYHGFIYHDYHFFF